MGKSRNKQRNSAPDCLHCTHYHVTWEQDQPRGCRAYAFKSEELPSAVVLQSSGEPCQLFERKAHSNRDSGKPRLLR